MQVILLQHVRNLGQKGEIKDVSPGYFQNFLAPQRLAVPATASQVQHVHAQQAKAVEKLEHMKESAESIRNKLEGKSIQMNVKASEAGKLYASVHTRDVATIIRKELNVEIPEKSIEMPPVKSTGSFQLILKLYKDISAHITLHVTAN